MENLTDRLPTFCCALVRRGCSPATVAKYRREVSAFCCWLKKQPGGTLAELAAHWKEQLLSGNLCPATVNVKSAAINGFLHFLGRPDCSQRLLRRQRRVFRDKGRDLSRNEYLRLVQAACTKGRTRLSLAMQTICATGIRVSELRFITVKAVYAGRTTVTGKGKCREILLPAALCKKLKRYLQQLGRWPFAGTRETNQVFQPVFLTSGGKPLDRSNLWREMRSLCRAASVEPHKVFPHNLRHLFAKIFYAIDKDIAKLADLLGHASIETTHIYIMETGSAHAHLLDKIRLLL